MKNLRTLTFAIITISIIAFCVSMQAQVAANASPVNPTVQQNAQSDSANGAPGTRVVQDDDRYRIGPGDVLEVRVFDRPQLTRDNVRVDGNGRIRMPLVSDEIMASCLSESELSATIAQRYKDYLKAPQVDVYVKQFSSQPVAVVGAVTKPGSFQMERRVRLRELITIAGGPSSAAGKTVQIIHDESAPVCDMPSSRPTQQIASLGGHVVPVAGGGTTSQTRAYASKEPAVLTLDLDALMRGTSGMNPYIRPGDFVNIPIADQVFVVGNVFKPSAIDLKQALTLSRAVAMAGGTVASTKRSSVRIIRSSANGNVEMSYDLTKIEQHSAPDPLLQAGDIVDVPTSLGKQIVRFTFTSIAPAYAIYGPLTLIH